MPAVAIAARHRSQVADVLLEVRAVDRAVLLFGRGQAPAELGTALVRRLGGTGRCRSHARPVGILSGCRARHGDRNGDESAGQCMCSSVHATPPSAGSYVISAPPRGKATAEIAEHAEKNCSALSAGSAVAFPV